MKNLRLLLLGLGCLPAFSGRAQKSLSLVAAGQFQGSPARFHDSPPTGAGVSLAPRLYASWLAGVAVGLSPRTVVQATVGYTSYGLKFNLQSDYSRQRYANAAWFQQEAFDVAIVGRRYFPGAARPRRAWFGEVGVDALFASPGITLFSFDSYDRSGTTGPGLEGSCTVVSGTSYRLGIRLGAGREWQVSPRSALALGLVASLGLQDLARYQVAVTTWQQGRAIDPVSYTNTIATRVSFVGLQARYRWQLLGSH